MDANDNKKRHRKDNEEGGGGGKGKGINSSGNSDSNGNSNSTLKGILDSLMLFAEEVQQRAIFDSSNDHQVRALNHYIDDAGSALAYAAAVAGSDDAGSDRGSVEPSSSIGSSVPQEQDRRLWVDEWPKDWWERCSHRDFPEDEFRRLFRMSKATFDMICDELDSLFLTKNTMIPVRQRVAVCIWRLATVDHFYDVGLDALVAVLGYLYSGRVKPLPKGVCVCVDDDCSHFGCRPALDFMVEVLYASFTFQISELVALYQRHLLDILDKVATDDILVVLSVANICGKMCERLLARCIEMIIKSDADIITLEKALPQPIVKQITDKRIELGLDRHENFSFPDKHVKRIHRALDSDDVELVRMLLKEGHTNLDEACALHYAVAYCDAKITNELLDLALADVNHKNLRGYSVLHVAAMRKEPKIIVSLLTKGALPSDLTLDGRKALQISKRLTKAVDYYKSTEEGKISSKDRLCIEILEQVEKRVPLLGEASLSLAMAWDDLRMKLLYLENRVGLAKVLFPMEGKVVMDIAQVDRTSEFPSAGIYSPNMGGSQRTAVDLNEAPFKMKEEHLVRMRALSRTVELGKRFFPRCSEVLNKIMDADDLSQLAYMGNDSPEERLVKRRRYMELQEVLSKAFNEDKEEFDRSAMSSSSSSTSTGVVRPNGKLAMKN